LLLFMIALRRKIVQRSSFVVVIVGVGEVFEAEVAGAELRRWHVVGQRVRPHADRVQPEDRVLHDQVPARVRAREAERVALDQRVRDRRVAVGAGVDVDAGVVEAARVDVVKLAVDRVRGEEPVAAQQARVVGGEPVAVPPVRADRARFVAAVEPDLVAAGVPVVAALAVPCFAR